MCFGTARYSELCCRKKLPVMTAETGLSGSPGLFVCFRETVPRRAWRSPAACRALTPGEMIAGLHTMRLLRCTLHIQVGTTLHYHPLLCSSFPDLLRATLTARPLVRLITAPTTAWVAPRPRKVIGSPCCRMSEVVKPWSSMSRLGHACLVVQSTK